MTGRVRHRLIHTGTEFGRYIPAERQAIGPIRFRWVEATREYDLPLLMPQICNCRLKARESGFCLMITGLPPSSGNWREARPQAVHGKIFLMGSIFANPVTWIKRYGWKTVLVSPCGIQRLGGQCRTGRCGTCAV